MENESNNSLGNVVSSNQQETNVIPTDQTPFVSVGEMFEVGETLALSVEEADLQANLGANIQSLNAAAIPSLANAGLKNPSMATSTYDPVAQQNPPSDLRARMKEALTAKSLGAGKDVASQRFSGIRSSSFNRFYEHPEFASLGFTPYSNMEEYYNANSTVWDDMARMSGQFTSLAGAGVMSTYRSIADLTRGEIFSPDYESAAEFEDAMAIGSSSRSGALAWTNNFLLNSAYTVGIIGSIAMEELALAGATAVSGGALAPAALAKTAVNVGKLGKTFFNLGKLGDKSRDILNTLKNVDVAKDFWNAAKSGTKKTFNVAGNIFTPNMVKAMKNVKTAENATQSTVNIAKMQAGFGGFYRDMRAVNLALAESKLEGGMVYNELVRTGVDIAAGNSLNGVVSEKDMDFIINKASEGAFWTTVTNAPLIYASNFFVLGNANSGFNRAINRTFNQTAAQGAAGRLFKKGATRGKKGELLKNVFADAGTGFQGWLKKLKAGGIKGNGGMAAAATLRYFSANVAEGLQEVGQEAVSAGTKGFYTAVLKDPMAGGIELRNTMIKAGMGEQFSGQGFSTFMSGFLMGGLIQGPQKMVFEGGPALYNRFSDPKAYKEYQTKREKLVKDLVDVHNAAWNSSVDDPASNLFDVNKLSFLIQKQVSDGLKENVFNKDMFGFTDEKDFSKFQQMYTVFSGGTSQFFRSQLQDYLKMSDEDLADAFSISKKDIESGKGRQRITDMIGKMDKMEDDFIKSKDEFPNPFNSKNFKQGTLAYSQELQKELSYEHARYLYMFTQDGFERALERSTKIFEKLTNDPLFAKMAANDLTVLLDIDSIDNELSILKRDIAISVETSAVNATTKKKQKIQLEKIKRLQAIKDILTNPKYTTDPKGKRKGTFSRNHIDKLLPEFRNYVRYMASTAGSFVDSVAIESALKDIVDHIALDERAKVYDKALEYLANPQRFTEIQEKALETNKELLKAREKNFKENIETYIGITEANELMNQLAKQGVYAAPSETKAFLLDGNINHLKTFFDENGQISPLSQQLKYQEIQRILDTYKNLRGENAEEVETEEVAAEEEAQETLSAQNQILDDAGINIILEKTNNTPLLNEILNRKHIEYSSSEAADGGIPLSFEQWVDTKEGLNLINTFNSLKKIWANGSPSVDTNGNDFINKPSTEDVNSEKGFKEWLMSPRDGLQENGVVSAILRVADLKANDFIVSQVVEGQEQSSGRMNTKRKTISIKQRSRIDKQTTKSKDGEVSTLYKVVDLNGKPFSTAIYQSANTQFGSYDTLAKAEAAQVIIEGNAPDSASFEFDGVGNLNQGQLVYDKETGAAFVILSTPAQASKGFLNMRSSVDKSIVNIQPGGFASQYTIVENNYEKLGSDVSRYTAQDLINPYPHVNKEIGKGKGEVKSQGVGRYNAIVSALTPEEFSLLEVVVSLDPTQDSETGAYKYPGKKPNKLIQQKKSKYIIGLRIPVENIALQNKVNAAVEKAGYQLSNSPSGVFAYLPNNNLQLFNSQGEQINGANMTRKDASNIVFFSSSLAALDKKSRLAEIHKMFAINDLLFSKIEGLNLTIESGEVILTQDILGLDLSMSLTAGVVSYPAKGEPQLPVNINELDYNTSDAEGNMIIFDWAKKNGKRTENFTTNLEGDPAKALYDKVKSNLILQQDWNKMVTGSDRYYAAVLLPNGKYALVNLKATEYTIEQFNELGVSLINRAQNTLDKNVKAGKTIESDYNSKEGGFNKTDITDKLFISTVQNYSISLQVTPWGSLQLELYDNLEEKRVGERIEIKKDIIQDEKISVADKMKTLITRFNDDSKISQTKVRLNRSNFRESFPSEATPEEIIANTTTQVKKEVRKNQQILISASGASIQAAKNLASVEDSAGPSQQATTQDVKTSAISAISSTPDSGPIAEETEILETETRKFRDDQVILKEETFTITDEDGGKQEVTVRTYLDGSFGTGARVKNFSADGTLIDNTGTFSSKLADNDIIVRDGTTAQERVEFVFAGDGYVMEKTSERSANEVNNPKKLAVLTTDQKQKLGIKTEVKEKLTSLEKIKQDIDSLEAKLLEGASFAEEGSILDSSEEYQKLVKKFNKESRSANKIMSESLDENDVEDINVFMDWADTNLPDYIAVDDITTLGNNLKAGGKRVGAFVFELNQIAGGVDVLGTIYTGAKNPFKYHEAFHGVYRMILTDEEIIKYRGIARKEVRAKLREEGKSFTQELQRFRNSADTYSDMSDKELENEYYEEYIADQFDKFKMDPKSSQTSSEIKSLFTRILDWIRSVFSTYSANELQTLFQKIDSGKFKGAPIANNMFTSSLQMGVTVEANALVPYKVEEKIVNGKKLSGFLYLDSDIANPLVNGIAAMYIDRTSKMEEAYNPKAILDTLINDYQALYNPRNPLNESKSDLQKIQLNNINDAFKMHKDSIKEQVFSFLNVITDQVETETYNADYFEDETGLRTTSQYDLDASLIGGFKSLSAKLRKYIATTSVNEQDYFGNTVLTMKDGVAENLIVPVDFVSAYNGLLKAVKNIENPRLILQSMYFFGQENAQAGAVVSRALSDIGITVDQLMQDESFNIDLNDPILLQAFIKGFENFRVDYLFNQRDAKGNLLIYSASERDDINSQLDRWNQAYIYKRKQLAGNKKRKEDVIESIQTFQTFLSGDKKGKLTDVRLADEALKFSKSLFDFTGIKLSPMFLQFSILQNRPANTLKQSALKKLYSEQTALTLVTLKELSAQLALDVDIFNPVYGMSSRLNTLSQSNAPFDETIGATVFKNPNGDLVYAHQLPTYHLKKIQSLNNTGELEALKSSDPYLTTNYLLNNSAFIAMSAKNMLKVMRVAGSKVSADLSEVDDSEQASNFIDTSTYGDFTPQEFALHLINNYTTLFNIKNNKVATVESIDNNGNKIYTAMAPSLIRVMEASNTGDTTPLPIIKAVNEKSELTDELLTVFINKIKNEYNRITREYNVETATEAGVIGYNTVGLKGEAPRAFEFFNTGLLIPAELTINLKEIAKESKVGDVTTLEQALKLSGSSIAQLKKEVGIKLNQQFEEFQTLIVELNITSEISKKITEGLVDSTDSSGVSLDNSQAALNLNSDTTHNLKQVFFNDYVNTGAINEIILGDQAISLTSAVDKIKRAKMQNAASYSAYSAIAAPEQGVKHNVEDISLVTLEEPVSDGIMEADAQMYITSKAFRYMFFGFGKLSPDLSKLIDQVEAGESISSDQVFGSKDKPSGLVAMQSMMNSKKLVYGDGQTFLKMSAFVLTKEYTSILNENTGLWEANPLRTKLHNLRVKLEQIESTKQTISIAAPLSAVKMKKQRVMSLSELDTDNPFTSNIGELANHTTLDARYMGLQVLNPSNKIEGIDPTQIKELITSEQTDDQRVEGLDMTVGEIRNAYNDALKARVMLSYKNKRNLIFSFDSAMDEFKISRKSGTITPKLAAYLNYATAGLKSSQSTSNLLEFFSMEDGSQKYNLNNPVTNTKFQQLFLSYFSKGVLAERIPSLSLTLVSDYGNQVYRRIFEIENGVPVRSEIIRDKTWQALSKKPEIKKIVGLTNENIPKEGVVVLDRLRSGVMGYDSKGKPTGQRHIEMMAPSHFKSVMDLIENDPNKAIPEVIAKLFAVRIPSQDNHSAMGIQMVDFMPVYYGSSAMFARELVEISGADFDIDKVLAQFKEFYVENNEFKEYGKKKLLTGQYTEYLRYVSDKVNTRGTIYSEAYGLYEENLAASAISNTPTIAEEKAFYQFIAEQNIITDAGLKEAGLKALQVLGLPITKEEYGIYKAKYGEPYNAPMNNSILDYRYALVSNKAVTEGENPISYSPANTEVLDNLLKLLVIESPTFANRANETDTDVDTLAGKIKAFTANKSAAIGSIVLPNLYLSLLTEYKAKLYDGKGIKIDGKTYDNFGVTVDSTGQRAQDTLSALITMATDNAKDRLVAKLGLNKHALGVVANMTALGIPIKTSILMINNPMIQKLYAETLNKKDKFEAGFLSRLESAYGEIGKNEKLSPVKVTDELLLASINSDITKAEQKSILAQYIKATKIHEFTSKMGSVTSLTKGLGQSIADVNSKAESMAELFGPTALIDMSKVYNSNSWQLGYMQIFKQIKEELLPSIFLTANDTFQKEFVSKVLEQMSSDPRIMTQEVKSDIATDVLSYLTIKAYQKNFDTQSQKLSTLGNNILYPSDEQSIVDVINRLRQTEVGKNNLFLNDFIISQNWNDIGNNTGLSLANANTFRRLTPSQKVDIQNDFSKLFDNIDTKIDASSIVNYMMVKDGLQVKYQSLTDSVSPYILSEYLDQINSVELAFKNEVSFESVYGLSLSELSTEFTKGYLESNVTGSKLSTFTIDVQANTSTPNEVSWDRQEGTLTIDKSKSMYHLKDYHRLLFINDMGFKELFTFRKATEDQVSVVYELFETFGSNQQTAIGFMFNGEEGGFQRPPYKAVRAYVKNEQPSRNDTSRFNTSPSDAFDAPVQQTSEVKSDSTQIQEDALRSENATKIITNDSVDIQIDPDAPVTNISDTVKLLEQMSANSESYSEDSMEAETIENVDDAMPVMSVEEQQLSLDLFAEINVEYPLINNFWEGSIANDIEASKTLRENNNIVDLEDLIKEYQNSTKTGTTEQEKQENFIDQIKKCNL